VNFGQDWCVSTICALLNSARRSRVVWSAGTGTVTLWQTNAYKAAISHANLPANLGPPSQTLCTQCHELSVEPGHASSDLSPLSQLPKLLGCAELESAVTNPPAHLQRLRTDEVTATRLLVKSSGGVMDEPRQGPGY
jgi:hypothetical protein